MEDEDFYLCKDCAKDIYLKKYVSDNATKQDKLCTICQASYNVIDISENPKLNRFCRFLIRYHFPEYIYNPHWGGEDFPSIFLEENSILNHEFANFDSRQVQISDFIANLFDLNNFPFPDLYYGHDEQGRGLFDTSIKEDGSFYWNYYKKELEKKNHYLLKNRALETFKGIFENHLFLLEENNDFYRARIGYEEIKTETDSITIMTKGVFKKKFISAPPIFKAKAGRLNRQGVSYLYLSSNKDVALGEVRPHPGQYVSIGCFRSLKQLKIADLRFLNLFEHFDDGDKLKKFLFLTAISIDLSTPVVPEDQEHYLITQFISDLIRDFGYDGIMFKSSLTTGYNLLAFDSSLFTYIEKDSILLKIKTMNYEVEQVIYEPNKFSGMPRETTTAYNNVYVK